MYVRNAHKGTVKERERGGERERAKKINVAINLIAGHDMYARCIRSNTTECLYSMCCPCMWNRSYFLCVIAWQMCRTGQNEIGIKRQVLLVSTWIIKIFYGHQFKRIGEKCVVRTLRILRYCSHHISRCVSLLFRTACGVMELMRIPVKQQQQQIAHLSIATRRQ